MQMMVVAIPHSTSNGRSVLSALPQGKDFSLHADENECDNTERP